MYRITYTHKDGEEELPLYTPGDGEYGLTEGKLKTEVGKSGELNISVPDMNPAKADLVCPTDEVIVYRNNKELWRGRPITKKNDFNRTGDLSCEGVLSYLYDTWYPGYDFQGPPADLIKSVLDNHNAQVESCKQIHLGIITVSDPNNYIARSNTDYSRSLSVLSDKLVGESLGGYLRIRVVDGIKYLDYLDGYGTTAEQAVQYGVNLLDLAETVEYGDTISAVLPLGAEDEETGKRLTVESVNDGELYVSDDALVAEYGWIAEVVEWDDVTVASNLLTKARTYLQQAAVPVRSLSIKAVDLSHISEPDTAINLGDMVRIQSDPHGINMYMELTSMEINLLDPSDDTLDFGAQTSGLTERSSSSSRQISESLNSVTTIVKNLSANTVTVDYLSANYATIANLNAANAEIENLKAADVNITGRLDAVDADITNLVADNVTINDTIAANKAAIDDLAVNNVAVEKRLTAAEADIETLDADKLSAEDADIRYANIDFTNIGQAAMEYLYAQSGLIRDAVIDNGTITGHLVGVTISGDLIEGNTIVAEKLVIKGEDGLYYKLNTDGITTEAEQTDYNSLSGTVIQAKSITAEKISVSDLVAFDATIGGFNLTEDSIYSGVKDSINNTTAGLYMGRDGQFYIGDGTNRIRFYKVSSDGEWKLDISASSITIGAGNTDIEEAIEQLKDEVTTFLYIGSSNGTCFKNDNISTRLTVTVYRGSERITDITALQAAMGSTAALQWSFQRIGEDTVYNIDPGDTRISDSGFTFTISADDVDAKSTFFCELTAD